MFLFLEKFKRWKNRFKMERTMQSTQIDFKRPDKRDPKDVLYGDSLGNFESEIKKVDAAKTLEEKTSLIFALLKWNRRDVGKRVALEMKKIIDDPKYAGNSGDIYLICAGEETGAKNIANIDKGLNSSQRAKNFDFNFHSNLYFFFCPHQRLEYRVLCGEYLLTYCASYLTPEQYDKVNQQMFEFANDDRHKFGERADIADTLSRIADPKVKELAAKLIENIGNPKGDVITVFQHAENVHNDTILESVYESLDILKKDIVPDDQDIRKIVPAVTFLGKARIDQRKEKLKTMKELTPIKKKEITGLLDGKLKAINFSLNRIAQDRNRFRGMLLVDILRRVFNRIELGYHENLNFIETKKDLKPLLWSRLLDELEEGSGLCASGYAARLVNVLCGFGLSIRISWEDQIAGNITGRIQKHLREITDRDLKDTIILGMCDLDDPEARDAFLDFFEKIEKSMYPELIKDYVKSDILKEKEFETAYGIALKKVTLITEDVDENNVDENIVENNQS